MLDEIDEQIERLRRRGHNQPVPAQLVPCCIQHIVFKEVPHRQLAGQNSSAGYQVGM
jgi:hypothetical protein